MAMVTALNPLTENGYDGSGINPRPRPNIPQTTVPSTPVTQPSGPMPTVPPGGVPSTPVQAPPQDFSPTAQNPLAPLNNYQAQQQTGSYQAPSFQGQANYQAQSYQAPQVGAANYNAQSAKPSSNSTSPNFLWYYLNNEQYYRRTDKATTKMEYYRGLCASCINDCCLSAIQ